MAGINISIARGLDIPTIASINVGTVAPASGDVQLSWNTTDTNGKALTRKDVILAAQALIFAIENGQLQSPAGTPWLGSPVL